MSQEKPRFKIDVTLPEMYPHQMEYTTIRFTSAFTPRDINSLVDVFFTIARTMGYHEKTIYEAFYDASVDYVEKDDITIQNEEVSF